jgi:hypothetical protein
MIKSVIGVMVAFLALSLAGCTQAGSPDEGNDSDQAASSDSCQTIEFVDADGGTPLVDGVVVIVVRGDVVDQLHVSEGLPYSPALSNGDLRDSLENGDETKNVKLTLPDSRICTGSFLACTGNYTVTLTCPKK